MVKHLSLQPHVSTLNCKRQWSIKVKVKNKKIEKQKIGIRSLASLAEKLPWIKNVRTFTHPSILDFKITQEEKAQPKDSRKLLEACSNLLYLANPSAAASLSDSTINSLKKVQVSHVDWWILRNPNFIIVENHPPTIFVDMSNIMPTVCRCPNMAH